jgi:hypothetical protein
MRQKGVRRLFVLKKRLVLAPSRSVSLFLPHTSRGGWGFETGSSVLGLEKFSPKVLRGFPCRATMMGLLSYYWLLA